jgi:hypothetical protein
LHRDEPEKARRSAHLEPIEQIDGGTVATRQHEELRNPRAKAKHDAAAGQHILPGVVTDVRATRAWRLGGKHERIQPAVFSTHTPHAHRKATGSSGQLIVGCCAASIAGHEDDLVVCIDRPRGIISRRQVTAVEDELAIAAAFIELPRNRPAVAVASQQRHTVVRHAEPAAERSGSQGTHFPRPRLRQQLRRQAAEHTQRYGDGAYDARV